MLYTRLKPGKPISHRFVFILFTLFAMIGIQACTSSSEPSEPQPYYNHAYFSQDGQLYRYAQDGTTVDKTGVDVSDHQGYIDWQAVAADGIEFAYIRIGYRGSTKGELYADDYFEYNLSASKDAGLERGVYFFSQAKDTEEAREEAKFVLQLLSETKLEYPVAFDSEMSAEGIQSRIADLTVEESSAVAQTFCETIEAGGYKALLYGNSYDLARFSDEVLARWSVWYAEYGALPAYTREFILWQYSASGRIAGIDTEVDLNLDLSTVS